MIARHYDAADAPALDEILSSNRGHDVTLDRDRIICAGSPAVGCLVWTPAALVHELQTGRGLAQKRIADLLVGVAINDALTDRFQIQEAIFLTDSDQMAEYALEMKAIEQFGKRLFTLRIR